MTWESGLTGIAKSLAELCNEDEELLIEVHVGGAAYQKARGPAVQALQALLNVGAQLMTNIINELSAFDYRWRPNLAELGELDEDARTIASFRYGGLLSTATLRRSPIEGSRSIVGPSTFCTESVAGLCWPRRLLPRENFVSMSRN